MEKDIIINHLERNGLTIDLVDNCRLFIPQGTIIKVRDHYAICRYSQNPRIDCSRCVGTNPVIQADGVCTTLMCTKEEREDDTEVFFELIDND